MCGCYPGRTALRETEPALRSSAVDGALPLLLLYLEKPPLSTSLSNGPGEQCLLVGSMAVCEGLLAPWHCRESSWGEQKPESASGSCCRTNAYVDHLR